VGSRSTKEFLPKVEQLSRVIWARGIEDRMPAFWAKKGSGGTMLQLWVRNEIADR
jgi:hypothetical protein